MHGWNLLDTESVSHPLFLTRQWDQLFFFTLDICVAFCLSKKFATQVHLFEALPKRFLFYGIVITQNIRLLWSEWHHCYSRGYYWMLKYLLLGLILLWHLNACVYLVPDGVFLSYRIHFKHDWQNPLWVPWLCTSPGHVNVIIAGVQTRSGPLVALLSITLHLCCFQLACGCQSSLK